MDSKNEIINSIIVLGKDDEYVDLIKAELIKIQIDLEPLRNLTLVQVETRAMGGYLQSCDGVTMAMEVHTKNPNQRIIMYAALPLSYIRNKKPNIDFLLSKPNVRLISMPFTVEQLVSAFDANTEIDSALAVNAMEKHIKDTLSYVWHDLKKAIDPLNPEEGWQKQMVNSGFEKARQVFPMLADKDNAFVLNFLNEITSIRDEVRKGEILDGVFCDIEGTLFSNGILNHSVLEFLDNKLNEGKKVTLWTDGNKAEIQTTLDENSITLLLMSKSEFAGAVVEIAIDDMDQQSFTALTKIHAKNFVHVQDLLK